MAKYSKGFYIESADMIIPITSKFSYKGPLPWPECYFLSNKPSASWGFQGRMRSRMFFSFFLITFDKLEIDPRAWFQNVCLLKQDIPTVIWPPLLGSPFDLELRTKFDPDLSRSPCRYMTRRVSTANTMSKLSRYLFSYESYSLKNHFCQIR